MCSFARADATDAPLLCPWCILKCQHGSAAKAGQRVDCLRQSFSGKPAFSEANVMFAALLRWCEATSTPDSRRPCRPSSSSDRVCEGVPQCISGDQLPHPEVQRPLARGILAVESSTPLLMCGSQLVCGPPPGLEMLPLTQSSACTSVEYWDDHAQKWTRYSKEAETTILHNLREGWTYTILRKYGRCYTVHHGTSGEPYQVREGTLQRREVRILSSLLL